MHWGAHTKKIFVTQDVPIKQSPYWLSHRNCKWLRNSLRKCWRCMSLDDHPWLGPLQWSSFLGETENQVLCQLYIIFNSATYPDTYPLPTIQEILDSLAGDWFFSSIHLNSGYWQCQMDQDSIDKTAFPCPLELFKFEVMHFGLQNASATFQRIMEMTLRQLEGHNSFVYWDDIIIYSASTEQHFLDMAWCQCAKYPVVIGGSPPNVMLKSYNW